MTRRLLVLAGVASIALTAWAAGNRAGTPRAATPPTAPANTSDEIAAPGRVEAMTEEINVGSELSGRLDRVLVDEGDRVMAGQVLATLDSSEYRARLASAEARLAIARAEYERLVNGSRPEERREAEAARQQAAAALAQTETERDRRSTLYREGAAALEEAERAYRDWRLARARLDELAEHARVISAEARSDEKARAKAAVDLAEAQVNEARARLDKTAIRAPENGTILRRHRKAGELVSIESGQTLIFVMADTSRLRVRVDVDESDVAKLAVGERVWVHADAYGDRRFGGAVTRVGQILGRKNIRTDEPTEKRDTKILETLVDLDPDVQLPLGLRVDVFIRANRN